MRAQTANGVVTTYLTRIDRVRLGDIVMLDVRAHINPGMSGDELLTATGQRRRTFRSSSSAHAACASV